MEQIFQETAIELAKVTPSFLVNELIDNGSLIVPKEKTNLAICGINHR